MDFSSKWNHSHKENILSKKGKCFPCPRSSKKLLTSNPGITFTDFSLITSICISKYKYIPSKLLKQWIDVQIHKHSLVTFHVKGWHLTPLSLPSTSYSYAVLPFQISHPISNHVGIEILGPKCFNCFFSWQYISIFKAEKENAVQPTTADFPWHQLFRYLGKVEICQLLHTFTLLGEGCNLRVWVSDKLLKKNSQNQSLSKNKINYGPLLWSGASPSSQTELSVPSPWREPGTRPLCCLVSEREKNISKAISCQCNVLNRCLVVH